MSDDPRHASPASREAEKLSSAGSRRTIAWTASLLVHAALALVVLATLRRVERDLPPDPERLVFVEPAPPPPPLAHAAAEAEEPAEAPPPEDRLVDAPTPRPRPSKRPTAKPTPPQRPSAGAGEKAAEETAASRGGNAGGVDGGISGGTVGGEVGGVVGSRGDGLIRAEIAASPPVVISRVLPEYPPQARSRHLEGRVLLQAIVDRDGRVEEQITVLQSQPPFDEAAVAALRQWRFTPGRDHRGQAVRVQIEVPMRFQLR